MKITIQAPENLSEITLRQYQEYLLLSERKEVDGEMVLVSTATPADTLRIFLRLSDKVIGAAPAIEVEKISASINELFKEESSLNQRFLFHSKEWAMIPLLDKMSWDEKRDSGAYFGVWEDMHKFMAVLFRPIISDRKGQYLIEDYKGSAEYAEELRDLPLDIVMGVYFFLMNLHYELLSHTPNYLLQQLTQAELAMEVSLPSGGTTSNLTLSVRAILEETKRLVASPSINVI